LIRLRIEIIEKDLVNEALNLRVPQVMKLAICII
jgi:hypothetical protein